MLGIGLVGIGFMGMIHYLAAQRLRGGKVVAICSRDRAKLQGDWTSIQGNFGPRGQRMDLAGVSTYDQFDGLLSDPAVTLIDLCVPNDQHAELAIRALEAGKHVLVEKPIALSIDDADRMLAAAERAGVTLMVAHVLPFFPQFSYALDAVQSGRYGALQAGHLTRVIARPDWSAAIGDAARTGGPAIDLHIHDTHFIALLAGPPAAVHSRGVVNDGAVVHLTTQYLHADTSAPVLSATSGALVQAARPFAHGYELYFERATLSLGIADVPGIGPVNPLTLILGDRVEHPTLGSDDPVDAFAAEIGAAVATIQGSSHPALSAVTARQALATAWAEVKSAQTQVAVPVL